jgi:hypothetical protein
MKRSGFVTIAIPIAEAYSSLANELGNCYIVTAECELGDCYIIYQSNGYGSGSPICTGGLVSFLHPCCLSSTLQNSS